MGFPGPNNSIMRVSRHETLKIGYKFINGIDAAVLLVLVLFKGILLPKISCLNALLMIFSIFCNSNC